MRSRLVGLLVGLAEHARGKQSQRATNRGERRAQLVAHGGDELIFEPVERIALADVAEAEHRARKSALAADRRDHILGRE